MTAPNLPGTCIGCRARVILIDGKWCNPSGIAHKCDVRVGPAK